MAMKERTQYLVRQLPKEYPKVTISDFDESLIYFFWLPLFMLKG